MQMVVVQSLWSVSMQVVVVNNPCYRNPYGWLLCRWWWLTIRALAIPMVGFYALQVVVVNDPRPHNPYGRLYTVEYLNNMTGSPPVRYINQPADVLKRVALESIKAKEVRLATSCRL